MLDKQAIASARSVTEGGASPAKVRSGIAGPLQTLKVRLLTIKITSVLSMPKRSVMGMVLNEVVPSDTPWIEVRAALVSAISAKTKRSIHYACETIQHATQFELALSGSDFIEGSEARTVEHLWSMHTHPRFNFLHVSQKHTKDRQLQLKAVVWLPGPYAEALRGKHVYQDSVTSNGDQFSLTPNFNSMASAAFATGLLAPRTASRQSPSRISPKYAAGQVTPTKARRPMYGTAKDHILAVPSVGKALGGRPPRLYSSMVLKTRTFVVDKFSISIDPNDCQADLVKKNSLPFEVYVHEKPFAQGTTKQAYKLRVKSQEGSTYPFAAKELFRDETGQKPSLIANKGHLLQELVVPEVKGLALEINTSTLYEVVLPPEQGRAWLVEPYISLDPPMKFSGTDAAGTLVLVDLQGLPREMPIVLFDVQTHTRAAESGLGDLGQRGIDNFVSQHKCQTLCQKLGLKGTKSLGEDALTLPLGATATTPERFRDRDGTSVVMDGMIEQSLLAVPLPDPVPSEAIEAEDTSIAPSLGSILLFDTVVNGVLAPAEVSSIDEVKKQATLRCPRGANYGESADLGEDAFAARLRVWAPEAAQIICGVKPHRLIDEWSTSGRGARRIRTGMNKLHSEAEWVQERQIDLYPHEEDLIVDWLSYDVLPECIKTSPELASDALRELGTGPGLVLGGLAVAISLLDKGGASFTLSSMYEEKHRLRRYPRHEALRTWDAMLQCRLPVGSMERLEFAKRHQFEVEDWKLVVGGFHLAASYSHDRVHVIGV
ncbi:hypothetical protein CALCODRAFT_513052 [Calocera cornea HHB12733]|uniref:Alpha-type protein kinase domain-containing protein n=1 Tax=Calocera cornea HHB12733 TaxID=1353952 RepID=A0A165CHZ7_9BASI|nr:hypothetical protein CALCODRAFT_513052 [Calocera cornea HHB12733]